MNYNQSELIINPNFHDLPRFKPKLKLGILASGEGTNFEAIISDINNNRLDAIINCLIVNNIHCPVIERAKKYSIPVVFLNHKEFESRSQFDKEITRIMKHKRVEAIVMAGWMRIVTKYLINEYKGRIINIHPSILPSYKGINAVQQALKNNSTITGCTVHLVEEELDSGEILVQAALPINDFDTEEVLVERVKSIEHKIISMGISIAAKKWRNQD